MDEELNSNHENTEIQEETEIVEEILPDGRRFVKRKRRERHVRKGRIKQYRSRFLGRFFISVLILLGFYYSFHMKGFYLDDNSFNKVNNSNIEIINNKIVPTRAIVLLLRDIEVSKKPIFMVKTNNIKKEIMTLAPVENVYIRRYAFPARLLIIIRERTPIITIAPDVKANPVAFFTSDGKLIGRDFLPLDKSYKTTLVLSYGNKKDDYHDWDLDKIKKIQKIVRYVETYSKEQVEYVDFRNPDDVFIKIKSVNIRLGKIDNTIFKRIERIPSVLPQVKDVKTKIRYLDLSWEKVNYLKLE